MVNKSIPTEMAGVFENIVIRASAGTGKTFQLSNRYLNLLISGVDCQEILATTFTKKGAGEILDRIIMRLARAALSAKHADTLQSEIGRPLSQNEAASVLQKLLRSLHRLEIGTLDSFFNRVARVFSLELGLPPAWDIVDEQQIKALSRKTIHELLQNEDVQTLIPLLEKGESTRRIATLIEDLVRRMYDVRRETTPEAWNKLEEVKTFLSADDYAEVLSRAQGMTFPQKNLNKSWQPFLALLESESWSELAETTWIKNVLEGKVKFGSSKVPPETLTLLESLIPQCRSWITNRLIKQNLATCKLLGLYGERIVAVKADTGQLRFEDVTERLVEFVSMWHTNGFSFRLDHQIKHLLLDEFQDTSTAQWKVVEPFARNVCQANDPSRSFFCVGDLKQAIFRWRGGVAEIFDLVESELGGLDAAQPLTTSYRSSPVVIDFVNDIFLSLRNYLSDDEVVNRAVHSWSDWFEAHSTARNDLSGHATIEYARDVDTATKRSGVGRAVIDRQRNENVISDTVARVKQLNEDLPEGKTIGVLVPSNREVSRLIFKLQEAGIRASEEGGTALTDSAAVELVLSALTLTDHPGNSIARFHVSHSPLGELFGLEPETQENQKANRESVVAGAAVLRRKLVLEGYGPTLEFLARTLAEHCTKRELTRLQHLVRLAYSNRSDSQRWSMRPMRFVEYVRDEVKIADASSARVRVMTIHKSKGLEFDSVVLPMSYQTNGWLGHTPDLITGRPTPTEDIETVCRYANVSHRKLLPNFIQEIFEADQGSTVRERMCRFYVATTRAVNSIHVIMSYSHKPNGKSQAGLLLSLLCPQIEHHGSGKKKVDTREEGLIYEKGDPDWFNVESDAVGSADPEIDSEKVEQYYLENQTSNLHRPLSTTPKSMRGIAHVRPSMLEGGKRVRLADTLTSPGRDLALEFGQLIHGCFEQVRWLDEGPQLSDDVLRERLEFLKPSCEQIDPAIARFRQLVEHDNLRTLLSTSSVLEQHVVADLDTAQPSTSPNRIEVHAEKRLAVLTDQGDQDSPLPESLIEGIVDRLVLVYENDRVVAADIVDFKTDQIDDTNLTDRIEFYRPQLKAYRSAVETMVGIEKTQISTRLVFVQTGQVVQVDCLDQTIDQQTPLAVPKVRKTANPKLRGKKTNPPAAAEKKVKPPKARIKREAKTKGTEIQQTFWSDGDPE